MITHSSIATISTTPLAPVSLGVPGMCYAKLEYFNPSESIKFRSARYMIEQAEKQDTITPGGTIVDASSGNHGVAVAMIGAAKGYKVVICVSEKISKEKLGAIRAYGAQVLVCHATRFIEDPESYHSQAKAVKEQTPNSFMPDQYFNTDNQDAHYSSLGPEIWYQTEGKITHFFAGAGTGGTISGVGRYLKEQNPAIKVIAFDAANSYRSTGGNPKPYIVEGMGIDFVSPVLNLDVIDDIRPVIDENALTMLKNLAHQQGLLVGPSSGAVAAGVQEYARDHMKNGDLGVMIFGDSGRAYLSKGFYTPQSTVQCCGKRQRGLQAQ